MNPLHRIELGKTECEAILRRAGNPLSKLSKTTSKKLLDATASIQGRWELKLVVTMSGAASIEIVEDGADLEVWASNDTIRKINAVVGSLGVHQTTIAEKLLEYAVSSESAVESVRATVTEALRTARKARKSNRVQPQPSSLS